MTRTRVTFVEVAERLFAPDIDPDGISRTPRPIASAERAMIFALVEDSIRDGGHREAAGDRALRRRRANAQWWWLDDRRGVEIFGSAAAVCAELGFDRQAFAAALTARWSAADVLLPQLERILLGRGAAHAWDRRPASNGAQVAA